MKLGKNVGVVDGVSGIGGVCRVVVIFVGVVKFFGMMEDVKFEVEKWFEFVDEVCKVMDVNVKL